MLEIHSWMPSMLGLSGLELIVFAIIYQETKITKRSKVIMMSDFTKWTNSTSSGVDKAVKRLIKNKYIEKEHINICHVRYCAYKCTLYKD